MVFLNFRFFLSPTFSEDKEVGLAGYIWDSGRRKDWKERKGQEDKVPKSIPGKVE